MVGLLVYGYATGTFLSRRIERATYDSIAFRSIAAGRHPDHDTLATFRRRFLDERAAVFLHVLELASEMKLLKLGTVALDGSKLHANASRHSALSHGHIVKRKEQLQPMLDKLVALPASLGQVEILLADAGFCSENNIAACEEAQIEPYIAVAREAHPPAGGSVSPNPNRWRPAPNRSRRWRISSRPNWAGCAMRYANRPWNRCSASSRTHGRIAPEIRPMPVKCTGIRSN